MERIALNLIAFDAGTQIREAISEPVVAEYAERMAEGAQFPPVVVYADGCCRPDGSVIYYLADGFHRMQAATRNQFVDIDAEVRPGTREDALWFAIGANKENGHRMTAGDKRHAIVLALATWPDRSGRLIAEQLGCGLSYLQRVKDEVTPRGQVSYVRVTGKDGKSYPASRPSAPLSPPPTVDRTSAPSYVTERQPARTASAPANGMQFARIAIMKLEEIRDDDSEREQAYRHVRAWLDAR